MKFIIKTTLLGGFTGAVWYGVFVLIALLFSEIAFEMSMSLTLSPIIFIVESYRLNSDDALGMNILFQYVPGLVFGMAAGFVISLYWSSVPEHKRKENKMLSFLKYRNRSFLYYCIFLGESTLFLVALLTPLLCILDFVFHLESPNGKDILIPDQSTALLVGFFMTIFSVLIIWGCENHIAKEKQSAAQVLPAGQQEEPALVVPVMLVGILLLAAMGIYMLIGAPVIFLFLFPKIFGPFLTTLFFCIAIGILLYFFFKYIYFKYYNSYVIENKKLVKKPLKYFYLNAAALFCPVLFFACYSMGLPPDIVVVSVLILLTLLLFYEIRSFRASVTIEEKKCYRVNIIISILCIIWNICSTLLYIHINETLNS